MHLTPSRTGGRALGIGLGLEGGEHGPDGRGAVDGGAGGGQDVAFGLAGMAEASYGYVVVQDAEGKGGDEGKAEAGGDEALGGPVLIGFDDPARGESGALEGGAGRGAAAADLAWAGVAYLAYLGVRAFRTRRAAASPDTQQRPVPLARSAREGLIVGLGNPKMVIFYLAFFPQFIHPAQGSLALQMLILGAVFWVPGAIWDLAFASASGTIGAWLQRRPRVQAAQPRLEGSAYLALAGWAAITGTRTGN